MEESTKTRYLGVVDYVVFFGMIIVSVGIGVYHSLRGNKSAEDFLMGSRRLPLAPVSMSLLSSFISAISLLGFPGEAYAHGILFVFNGLGAAIGVLAAAHICVPVFYSLKITSINQYIELRFKSKMLRLVAVTLTIINNFFFMGICLYAPTLVLGSVTPLDINTYIVIVGIACTIYSTVGGVRAVIWADVFQLVLMFLGVCLAIVVGCVEVGGIGAVWQRAAEGNRTDVWVILYINIVGVLIVWSTLHFAGLCAYAVYKDCDPLESGLIRQKDEILQFLIMDKVGHLYGIPGLFVAALFGGALSSLSSVINAQVGLIWMDLLQKIPFFRKASDAVAARTNKILSLVVGSIMIISAFLTSEIQGLIQAGITISAISLAPMFSIFVIGVLFPFCGKIGCWSGFIVSWLFMAWVSLGDYFFVPNPEMLPFSTEGCPANQTLFPNVTSLSESLDNMNLTVSLKSNYEDVTASSDDAVDKLGSFTGDFHQDSEGDNQSALMSIYKISYTLKMPFGMIICILTAVVATLLTGREDPQNYPETLVLPALRRYFYPQKDLGKSVRDSSDGKGQYFAVELKEEKIKPRK